MTIFIYLLIYVYTILKRNIFLKKNKNKKDSIIILRLNKDDKELFKQYCLNNKTNFSEILTNTINNKIKGNK